MTGFGGPLLLAPLSSVLGIRAGMNVSVHNAPEGFMEAFLPMPEGATLVDSAKTGLDVQVLFAARKVELIERLAPLTQKMAVMGALWICFPTAADDGHAPSEDFVRLASLEMGLTDTKKVLLGPGWAALKLQWKPRPPRPEIPSVRA